MSSNVGLSTPRGSGTSGYIQRNKSFLRSRDQSLLTSGTATNGADLQKYRQRAPDKEILLHDRKRAVEVKCLQLQDKLEEEDKLDEDEIAEQVDALRRKLLEEVNNTQRIDAKGLKPHQVHELAAVKMVESERLRNALGISKDYEEGSHWRRQEEDKIRRQERREQHQPQQQQESADFRRERRRERQDRSRSRSASPPRRR